MAVVDGELRVHGLEGLSELNHAPRCDMHRHVDLRCQKYRRGAGRFDPRRNSSELEFGSSCGQARAGNMVS
jgi:hypothetical protein